MALVWKRGLPFQHGGPIMEGTAANRPAAAAATDTIYFATDTGVASYSDGATWTVIAYSVLSASDVPDVSATYQVRSERAAASGYASLDAGTKVPSAQLGSSGGGAGTKVLYDDQTFKTPSATGVSSLAKSGSTGLTGAVTLSAGANVTLTQAGQDISIAASGSGGTGWTSLYDTTLGASAASFDVSGISGAYTRLVLIALLRSDEAAVTVGTALLRFNNDSAANYDVEYVQASAATAAAANTVAGTSYNNPLYVGAAGRASNFGYTEVTIDGYADATREKVLLAESTAFGGTANTTYFRRAAGGRWRNTAAINRVTILPASGNWVTGSRLIIWGL